MRILMVCLGNICRSPLAEGIMQAKVNARGLDWSVDSAGTSYWHAGEGPDRRSQQTAKQHELDISHQKARQFKASDLDKFDLILAMDRKNLRDIINLASNDAQREKVRLVLELAYPGEEQDVPDPYWDDDGFEQVYQMLDDACERILEQIERGGPR